MTNSFQSKNNVKIEFATSNDFDFNFINKGIIEICKIEKEKPESNKTILKKSKIAINNKEIIIAKEKECPIGFLQFSFRTEEPYGFNYGRRKRFCWIEWLYVPKKFQRIGVGKSLIDRLEKICKENKVKEIILDVFENNQISKNFCQKAKFKKYIKILKKQIKT